MKRKLGFLIFLVIVLLLIFVGYKFFVAKSPSQGVLKVNSTPGSSVFLEDKHLGISPLENKVDSGEFTIKLVPQSSVESFPSWEGRVKISPNLLTYVNASLGQTEFMTAVEVLWLEKISSKTSEVSVITNPDGATVAVDGETKGVTPLTLTDVAVGDHTVTIASPGFLSRTLKVKATAGFSLNAVVKLALSGSGIPEPTATPSGSLTPADELTPTPTKGSTSTNLKKPYVTINDTPTGFLRVRSEPSTSASESGRVKPGENYSLIDEEEGWYKIQVDTKTSGWISGQYAEKTE